MGVVLRGDCVSEQWPLVSDHLEKPATVFINEREREISPREVMDILIVCGDCSGDEELPRKTKLTGDFRCENCGGRSYALAARMLARELGRQSV